jgi:hypothetical protein
MQLLVVHIWQNEAKMINVFSVRGLLLCVQSHIAGGSGALFVSGLESGVRLPFRASAAIASYAKSA